MLDDQTTLADFFVSTETTDARLEELESSAMVADLRAKMAKEFDGLRWSAVWDSVVGQVEKILEIRFVDIFLGAWTKYEELRKYCDPALHSSEETHLVPLVEHSITSTHQPSVEIEIGELFREKIPFEIAITLKLSGMLLQIREGKILKVYTGRCEGNGSVRCSGISLIEKEASGVQLPGVMDLGDGIAIQPA
ncbi:MAG: hypothetical protein AB9873_17280 [Syntrophobacteraceae bacterium]